MENLIKKSAFSVDVRTPEEFGEEHIVGSTNIPLSTILQQMHQFKNKEQIVVFCLSGARSTQAKSILEQNGFKNVTNGGGLETVKKMVQQG